MGRKEGDSRFNTPPYCAPVHTAKRHRAREMVVEEEKLKYNTPPKVQLLARVVTLRKVLLERKEDDEEKEP
jgi:hypothetical protein